MGREQNKPIIGLTTYERERRAYCVVVTDYVHSVFAAGGLPVPIPTIADDADRDAYLDMVDGILFTGGADINPACYGEEPLWEVESLVPYKDDYELGLFRKAYERSMPIFGVCRGSQLINVGLGGTLYQDIHAQIPGSFGHYPKEIPEDELYHSVHVREDSRLRSILGVDTIQVNSFHHQAIKALGGHLAVGAVSTDRIIESIEGEEGRFLLGVQWHPECLTKRYPAFLKLFASFVEAAAGYRADKSRA